MCRSIAIVDTTLIDICDGHDYEAMGEKNNKRMHIIWLDWMS